MASGDHGVTSQPWFAPAMGLAGSFLTAAILWLGQRLVGKAAWQQAITTANKELIDALQFERKEIRAEYEAYKIEAKAAQAQMRGEIINLTQAMQSLKMILRNNNIPFAEDRYEPAAFETMKDES